ncbi:hypothetical protein DID88_003175 [Monilinia fructigena]|uniref:Uncharacterized protein n=1 Tax=Monilinia fructigena TaxID=38457 RepID=A0A395IUK1_9HELO|nr:hypothetical protein DID88_003175 [Monilinia fructigena]
MHPIRSAPLLVASSQLSTQQFVPMKVRNTIKREKDVETSGTERQVIPRRLSQEIIKSMNDDYSNSRDGIEEEDYGNHGYIDDHFDCISPPPKRSRFPSVRRHLQWPHPNNSRGNASPQPFCSPSPAHAPFSSSYPPLDNEHSNDVDENTDQWAESLLQHL